jgi:hypothetical protein
MDAFFQIIKLKTILYNQNLEIGNFECNSYISVRAKWSSCKKYNFDSVTEIESAGTVVYKNVLVMIQGYQLRTTVVPMVSHY